MMRKIRYFMLLTCIALVFLIPATCLADDDPAISTDACLIQNGDVVYFGIINNQDAPWLVLSDGNDSLLPTSGKNEALLYANLVAKTYYNFSNSSDPYNTAWKASYVKDYCNDFYENWSSSIEKAAIASTSVTETIEVTQTASNLTFSPVSLTGEYVFLLSAYEATKYFENDADRILIDFKRMKQQYWLRSPLKNGAYNAIVAADSGSLSWKNPNGYSGIRVALNLDLEKVLAVSSASGGKTTDTGGELQAVGTNDSGEWKLTFMDSSRTFSADASENAVLSQSTGYSNWSIDVVYAGSVTGTSEFISALLCDSTGQVLYYGNVTAQTDGTAAFSIPDGLAAGKYTLKVCNEQINDDLQSDYSSGFENIELNVIGEDPVIDPEDESDIVLPADIQNIGPGAFEGIAARSVFIPDGCETIGSRAFANCPNLEMVRIPDSVKIVEGVNAIADDAFEGCDHVYLVGKPGNSGEEKSAVEAYCETHDNCTFVSEEGTN